MTSSSPQLYHWFVRPKWFTKKYIHDQIQPRFAFNDKVVLDFGSGTGANCSMFKPLHYLGIDPDESRIHYARRSYPNYKFHVLENGKVPVDDKSVDYILIIAVLHHISSGEITEYMKEFKRVLKPDGNVIVMEPCMCQKKPLSNWFMNFYDNGEYIRNEEEYIQLFRQNEFSSQIINRFRKCLLYHELFFSASLK
ncbi:ubiquinone/menaquinone biosynthesis C-methylase UbiE [Paenibacillus forsythiae]|uniref:Ubiquinone/menaquinone biosynthesis C-methylase UbiE n=1 Tax=Paenibacillus forsythiae TaxID=365616 RepID=A0ABU3H207_9BACL|nr:class I SAM-dependent methyltransferase [Paenibacillus forsythiae]MDT3424849.1 ubiquinone/menaquinone biosynthesis C-methylase UbiE [Paenibacillus forsythiae]